MTVTISRDHNPLRDPDDRRLNRIAGPSALVIFGVTGDLSRKKLMPAVYDLANRGLLPPGFGLVGFARPVGPRMQTEHALIRGPQHMCQVGDHQRS